MELAAHKSQELSSGASGNEFYAYQVGINGCGRIGRLALRAMLERDKEDLAVVAVNDMADLPTNAHLFRYDSTNGIYPGTVEAANGRLIIDGREIAVISEREPAPCRGAAWVSILLSSLPASLPTPRTWRRTREKSSSRLLRPTVDRAKVDLGRTVT